GFKPRQLFGLMGEKRRDDLDSLAGLIPRARPIYRARNNYLIHTRAGDGFISSCASSAAACLRLAIPPPGRCAARGWLSVSLQVSIRGSRLCEGAKFSKVSFALAFFTSAVAKSSGMSGTFTGLRFGAAVPLSAIASFI